MSVALHVLNAYYSFPMDDNLKLIFWNVRGLNRRAKRTDVRSVISSTSPCIVCLQETKLALVSSAIVFETLSNQFEDFYLLPANGTRGGILLAWRHSSISLSNPTIGDHHVSAIILDTSGANPWWITGVYGPQGDDEKLEFISELQDLWSNMASPWLVGGDFNVIASAVDKNNTRLNYRKMNRFLHFIADQALHDIYLHGRRHPPLVRM